VTVRPSFAGAGASREARTQRNGVKDAIQIAQAVLCAAVVFALRATALASLGPPGVGKACRQAQANSKRGGGMAAHLSSAAWAVWTASRSAQVRDWTPSSKRKRSISAFMSRGLHVHQFIFQAALRVGGVVTTVIILSDVGAHGEKETLPPVRLGLQARQLVPIENLAHRTAP
jgi:hypothetical protein